MAKRDHNGHNGHGHVREVPDVSYIKNVDVTHETSDVNVPALLKFVLALTIMTAVVYLLMLFLFSFLNTQERENEPPAGPMAMREQLPPEPRLQSAPGFAADLTKSVGDSDSKTPKDPLWEIRVLREQWERDLLEGAKDQSGRTLGMPIKDATEKFVADQNAKANANNTVKSGESYDDHLPTAASSGRVSIKGKQ